MKRILTPFALFAAAFVVLTPMAAEAGRVPSKEEREQGQRPPQRNDPPPRPQRNDDDRPRNNNNGGNDYGRPRDDGGMNRAISAGSSRGRVLDTRPSGSNYVVRVQTPDGRRVDLVVDGRTGRVISEN